jgi:phage terminase large subunit-like protein
MVRRPPDAPVPAARTRGERVIAFIERYCVVPEGRLVGQPVRLVPFQKKFILDVYDNPHGTSTAILSIARKNGKTALIAGLLLAHLVGPEAVENSQIVSGAQSRDQSSLVFKLAAKMIRLSSELRDLVRIVPSTKVLIGLRKNVEYRALSAEAKTAHGLSPILAILDETGQVRGPQDDFVDALTTAQGAHERPLVIVISTQAATDADLLSVWIDDALKGLDPTLVCHVYAASDDADLEDPKEWAAANPAIGLFRSRVDVEKQAARAKRMPSAENTFRNLILNQRVSTVSPFISRSVWLANAGAPDPEVLRTRPVYAGLDLSSKLDLTSLVLVALDDDGIVHSWPYYWTPAETLRERAKRDRAPYEEWVEAGAMFTSPGSAIDYEVVARWMAEELAGLDLRVVMFDRWRIDTLKKELERLGVELPLHPHGQGFKDMAPALDSIEALLVDGKIRHGGNPVLTANAANAVVEKDAAGNRKLTKAKATGRIDGMVALVMALAGLTAEDAEVVHDEVIVAL